MATRKDVNNVGPLPLIVREREFEPAAGLIRRLATRAGHRSVRSFLRTVPNCPTWLAGELDRGASIEILSRMSGIEVSSIRAATPAPMEDGTYLGGVLITQTDRAANGRVHSRGRVCPACLLEDRDFLRGPVECRPFRRLWWDLAEFEGCPRHCQALIHNCPSCRLPLRRYLLRPDICLCGFDLTRTHASDRVEDAAEQPLLSILLGAPKPCWTAEMSLRSMSGLALRVGAVHVFGPSLKELRSLPTMERMELLAIGWSCLDGGKHSFAKELSNSIEQGSPKSPNQAYGEVYRWLARTEEPGLDSYREALLEHAQVNLRLDIDREVFGTTISARPRRRKQSICPPAQQFTEKAGGNSEMRQLLGITQPQLVRYLAVNDRDRLPSPRNRARFDVERLEEFLRRIEEDKPRFNSTPRGLVQVMQARSNGRKWPQVVREIRSGRLPLSGTLHNQRGLYRWLVDPELLRGCLPRRSDNQNALTCADGIRRLGVPQQTLAALRRAGLLRYGSVVSRSDRLTVGPTLTSIEAFERDFVTSRQCATMYGRRVMLINTVLRDEGVVSVIPAHRDVIAVYHRADAEEALQSLFGDRVRD